MFFADFLEWRQNCYWNWNCIIFSVWRRCRLEGELENATYDNSDINLRHASRYSKWKHLILTYTVFIGVLALCVDLTVECVKFWFYTCAKLQITERKCFWRFLFFIKLVKYKIIFFHFYFSLLWWIPCRHQGKS